MARSIKLTKLSVQNVSHKYLGAYRLRVEASEAVEMEAEVFVYLRHPRHPEVGGYDDLYEGVASPVDMAEYPAGIPAEDATPSYFRLDYFELDFRSTGEATEAWEDTKTQVCVLREALDRLEDLEIEEQHVCGTPPDDSSASSDSSL